MAINEKATVEVSVNGQDAKNELRDLEKYATALKGRLADAMNAGDVKKIKQVQKEIRNTEREMRTLRSTTTELNRVMANLSSATPKELQNTLRAINRELNSGRIQRGTAEWRQYQQQARQVTAEMQRLRAEGQASQGWLTRFNNGFSKWGGLLASAAAAVTGVSLALSSMRKNRDGKEASQAELKALTGLDDQAISWLTTQAETLSTSMEKSGLRIRQSSEEILKAYMVVGSKKPELLANKEALNAVTIEAMRLAAAAGIDLPQAVDATTVSLNMFNEGADQAGKYVNILAAGSKVGAANVSAQATAIKNAGVSASGAGVPMEGLVGTIQTLAEKGIEAERAGTALRNFFLVLQTGPDNTNPKVVGLEKALENLNKQGLSAEDMVKRFGKESYDASVILRDNVDKVKEYTAAVTGSNIAMEQAAINSATNEAKMAQLKNQLKETGIELMERLNPSLSMLTGWTTKLIKIMPGLIDWVKMYGVTVVQLSVIVGAYVAGVKLATLWETRFKDAKLLNLAADKLRIVWIKACTAAEFAALGVTSLLGVGMGTLSARVKVARAMFLMFFQTLKLNPLGAILTIVTAIGIGIYKLATYTTQADKAIKDFAQQNIKQQIELQKLKSAIDNANKGSKERVTLIKEFNDKYGTYLGQLLNEKATVLEVAAAYREAATAIQNKIATQAIEKQKEEITSKSLNKRGDYMADIQDVLQRTLPSSLASNVRATILDYINQKLGEGFSVDQVAAGVTKSLSKSYKQIGTADLFDLNAQVKNYAKVLASDLDEIGRVEKRLGSLIVPDKKVVKPLNELDEIVVTPGGSATVTPVTVPEEDPSKSKDNPQVIAENKRYQDELKQLKESYLKSDQMTQQEYARFAEDTEMRHLDELLKIAGLEATQRESIEQKVLDMRIKFKEACAKEDADTQNQMQAEAFTALEKEYQIEVQKATQHHYENLTSEESYYQTLLELQNDYYQKALSSSEISEEKKAEIRKSIEEESLKKSEKRYNEYNEKMKETFSTYSELGKGFGEAFAELITDTETGIGEFAKNIIKLTLDTLQKVMIAAIAERTIKNIATLGFAGVAKAAGEIALITAAFETAKGVLGNFYTGGYTGSGKWDDPKGIVHANEFVVNRHAVANPTIKPILDLIDHAQRTNTIGSLTAVDVSRTINHEKAIPNTVHQSVDVQSSSDIAIVLAQVSNTVEKLHKRLDERIIAETYIAGKRGVSKNLNDYNQLIQNAKR